MDISKIITKFYQLESFEITYFQRDDVSYSTIEDRKVYVVIDQNGKKYILKQIQKNWLEGFEDIYTLLHQHQSSALIYPIHTIDGNYVANDWEYYYILMPFVKLVSVSIISIPLLEGIIQLNNTCFSFPVLNHSSYLLDNELKILEKKFKIYENLLKKTYIDYSKAVSILYEYRNMSKYFGMIYTSVSHTNFYTFQERLICTDIDSIRLDNQLYFWIWLLFLVFYYHKDILYRYTLYEFIFSEIWKKFTISTQEFRIALLYYTLRPLLDIDRPLWRNEFIIKNHFMKDILLFQWI